MFPSVDDTPLRQLIDFGRDPLEYLRKAEARHGDHFIGRFLGDRPRLWVSNPESIAQVLALPRDAYVHANDIPLNVGERSVLFADGPRHLEDRRRLSGPFRGERMREYGPLILDAARTSYRQLVPGARLEMRAVFQEMALDVILRCIFGVDSAASLDRLRVALGAWLDASLSPGWFIAGNLLRAGRVRRFLDRAVERARRRRSRRRLLPWDRAVQAKVEVDARILEESARCRAAPGDRVDILAQIIGSGDGHDDDDAYLLGTLLTLLVGGHETTANSLCWTLYHLLPRAEDVARVRAEIDAAFGAGPIDPRRIGELVYLDAVVKEAARLNPTSLGIARVPTRPLVLGGHAVPEGLCVNLANSLAQRRPDHWADPDVFRPERFLAGAPPRGAYFPFGGGARLCIGQPFADYEMRVALAELLAHHPLRRDPDADERPVMKGISLAPTSGLRVIVEPPPAGRAASPA
ncbi:MAG: cytochrome P450 [Nannocystaceae bacterium]